MKYEDRKFSSSIGDDQENAIMASTEGPTFVLSINDLESAMICALVKGADNHGKALGQVIDIEKPWGRTDSASLDAADFAELTDTVVLVEVNSPQMQDQLREAGKELVIIDHHLYQSRSAGALDMRQGLSSLEQIIKFTDHQPGDCVAPLPAYLKISLSDGRACSFAELARLISANDRGHIPLLASEAMNIVGLGSCNYKPPEIKHRDALWQVREEGLDKIRDGLDIMPATWDGSEQIPAAWQTMEELVRDIRIRETTVAQWVVEGKPIEELAKPEVFERQNKITADLMDQAVEYISHAAENGKLRLLATGRKDTTDPALYLIQAPIKYRKVLFDALYFWRTGRGGAGRKQALNERLSALIVFHEDDNEDTPRLLEFYGSNEQSQAVGQWFEPGIRRAWGTMRLDFWAGGGPGCFFGAEDRLYTEAQALNDLADHVLHTVLTGNRPLERWRTSFLQPLRFSDNRIKEKALRELKKSASREPHRLFPVIVGPEERHYFLPHAEPTLAPASLGERTEIPGLVERALQGKAIASFERSFEKLYLQLVLPNHPKPYWLRIERVRLHYFYHSVMVLEWVICDEKTAKDDQVAGLRNIESENQSIVHEADPRRIPFWKSLLDTKERDGLSLGQVLDINAKLRECYSTFATEGGDRSGQAMIRLVKKGRVLGSLLYGGSVDDDRITGWFGKLLAESLGLDGYDDKGLNSCLELLSDDRARVVSSIVPSGAYPDTPWGRERFEEILARFNTVDPYGQGHYYEPRVAQEELRQGLYDRFRSDGSLIACTAHSLVYLGFGWYSLTIVHRRHMATMYRRMFLVAMFYQSILHSLALSLNEAGLRSGRKVIGDEELKGLRYRIIYFTNHLWFRRLSSQVQGIELFDLLSECMGLDQEYQEIADEIERAESFHSAEARERTEAFHGAVALLGAPVALFVALLTIPKDGYFYVWGYLENISERYLSKWLGAPGDVYAISLLLGLVLSLIVTWLGGVLIYHSIKWWRGWLRP